MDIKNFRAGTLRKQLSYQCFIPEPINTEWIISSPEINNLLSEANLKLGELNAFSQYIPDVDFFIMMHVIKEATTSSRIEGTRTSIEEALMKIEDIYPERHDDWQEVQNYVKAMNKSIDKLRTLPLSNRLLRQAHKTLLQEVRGKHKMPGEFRTSQNWIGGATLKDAVFIPPHHSKVPELMSDLEKLLNNANIQVPHLIKIAIAHYQFETIHPFLDGNGRIGRLLITLYLVSSGILVKPTLYLSDFFERNRTHYYDNLMLVRTTNNMSQWLKFFLVGIIETSNKSINTFQGILKLKEKIEGEKIIRLGSKLPKAKKLVNELYKMPVMTAVEVSEILDISLPTANTIIKDFVKLNILEELTGFKRNRIFAFKNYIKLFN